MGYCGCFIRHYCFTVKSILHFVHLQNYGKKVDSWKLGLATGNYSKGGNRCSKQQRNQANEITSKQNNVWPNSFLK